MHKPKLGEQLVAQGLISESQLQEAVARQAQSKGHIGSILIELGHISIDDLLQCLRKIHGVPGVNLFECNVEEDVLGLVADKHLDPQLTQLCDYVGFTQVAAADLIAHGPQDPGNARHPDTANPDKMDIFNLAEAFIHHFKYMILLYYR